MMTTGNEARDLYGTRPLTAGHPDIESRELAAQAAAFAADADVTVDDIIACVGRAVTLDDTQKTAAVVGCGPLPGTVKRLGELGWRCVGIEPVADFAASARDYLGEPEAIREGSAEHLPVDDGSQRLVIMENVLEHVDSPARALAEAFRALAPGGVAYVSTTNRLAVSNGEFTLRFFQWLPRLVKESYIHHHLHFEPALARYTSRPAVHWFTYAGLCDLGRTAGFYRFYSKLDLLASTDAAIRKSRLRGAVLDRARLHPWLRSIALTQKGGSIFMVKRPR